MEADVTPSETLFSCSFCSYCCSSWRDLNRHFFVTHSSEPSFLQTCVVAGCSQTFQNYSSFNSHLNRKHRGVDVESEARKSFSSSVLENAERVSGRVNSVAAERDTDIHMCSDGRDVIITETCSEFELEGNEVGDFQSYGNNDNKERSAALLLLTVKERFKLTQSAVDFIIQQVKSIISYGVDDIREVVQHWLENQGVVANFTELDVHLEPFRNPFSSVETEYMQSKFYRDNFNLVEPRRITLGDGSNNDSFEYIPLLLSLKALLQHPEISDEVLKDHFRTDGLIGDYCDTSFIRNDPYFQDNENALQLLLYFDEVEVCDVLASHRGEHKLGLFYYTIANLRPELRSTHRSIQLLAVVKSSLLVEYGFGDVLEPFINDVTKLYNDGLSVSINGSETLFCGTVVAFLADTLAAHDIGGFKIGVSFALRKCRVCMATQNSIQTKFTESAFTLRSKQSHDYHCSLLRGPFAEVDSVTYGVNSQSILNKIPNFHVANGQMPQDLMHILFEGVVPFEIKLMLKTFIYEKRFFDLDLLNSRLSSFKYGRNESRTKPPKDFDRKKIAGDSSLGLSASQAWTFAVILPLIIGHKVPDEDIHWECFLLLLQIIQLCTAKVSSVSSALFLASLVDQHHQIFVNCYPGVNLLPKMHYMVHFSEQILRLGPLVTSWCMRMEAKNSYFKQITRITNNFKNISLSVASRHQKLLCGYLQSKKLFAFNDVEIGPCKESLLFAVHPKRDKLLYVFTDIHPDATITHTNWIKTRGEEYHRGDYIVTAKQTNDLPVFSKIVDLMMVVHCAVVEVERFLTTGLENHLLSYQIKSTHHHSCIPLSTLKESHPFTAHTFDDGQLYITMRSNIEANLLEAL